MDLDKVKPSSSEAAKHRLLWEGENMEWQSAIVKQPKKWNPINTLAKLALAATRARTKGRPPRMN